MSLIFKKADVEEIEDHIEEIYDKGLELSNYFQNDLNGADYHKTDKSILVRKRFDGFDRLYFLTNDKSDLLGLLSQINGVSVLNIPTREDDSAFGELFADAGFEPYRVYEMYDNAENRGNDAFVSQFAKPEDLQRVKFLLYDQLDAYADHLPNEKELLAMISENRVLTNVEDGGICGVFIYSMQGRKCYFNFWVDKGKNGLFLLFNMYNLLKEKGIDYTYLWVNTQNEKVRRIHKLLKSKPTGTKDYIYLKQ